MMNKEVEEKKKNHGGKGFKRRDYYSRK